TWYFSLSIYPTGRSPPVIRLKSDVLESDEVVLKQGTEMILRCEGDSDVMWHLRLAKLKKFIKSSGNSTIFKTDFLTVEFTGTYKCAYKNQPDLYSSVHIYVKDPRCLFTAVSTFRPLKKEGEDCLLPCLLTDPSAADFSLRMVNSSALPAGMNYTTDPRKGITIRDLRSSYNADYVCSAKINGVEMVSRVFSINVILRLRFPPYVFLNSTEYIRLVGEELRISCKTHNPNFNYNVTWIHTSSNNVTREEDVRSDLLDGSRLNIKSILTIRAVTLSDTGNYTCIGVNEAGINSSTTYLKVIEKPYVKLSPKLPPTLDHDGLSVKVYEGMDLELGVYLEAYPTITFHEWEIPSSHNSTSLAKTFNEYNYRYDFTLILKRMTAKEQGLYTFRARNAGVNASLTFRVQTYQKPVATVKRNNATTLTCTVIGFPAPQIQWYQCSGIRSTCSENATNNLKILPAQTVNVKREDFGPVEVDSVLTVDPASQRETLECVAKNLAGEGKVTVAMDVSQNKLFVPTVTGSAVLAAVLLLLLLILLYKYKQKPRYEIRWKIIEASNGNNYTFIDPTQLPYNEKWEFPRDKLRLGKVLGAGAFGKVVEATAYGLGEEDNVTRVAVKMLKRDAHSDEKEALISELKILSHLGNHKNIVNLLGACTHGGPVLVITEYCKHGDLLNFLRNKAETFLNFVMSVPGFLEGTSDYKNVCIEKKYIRSDSGISSSCSDSYLEMKPSGMLPTSSSCEEANEDTWPLDMDDLLRFSYQVAQGLDFLASRNCIHRDVAARNVLLTDGRIAKICDFGLARDIMNDSNYVVKGNARLPVKWMAPESIFDCVYTVQSDVWSYGILLWEIFSLGKSPYPSILVDSKFYKMIKCGYQMSRPDFAPPEMYTIMKICWNLDPTKRPTFSKISQLIERLLGEQPEQDRGPTHCTYQNVQQDAPDEQASESFDTPKCCEESCDQACDHEEEEHPLIKTNNYQFC
uniref:receptor protein-tyrosine kinase n=1 Tax=Scleropages formosus TaxID=113540 RepID=A0A8C9S1U1_SCLFO